MQQIQTLSKGVVKQHKRGPGWFGRYIQGSTYMCCWIEKQGLGELLQYGSHRSLML